MAAGLTWWQEFALECFCNDRDKFTALFSNSLVIEPLTPENSETLWALVDHSTMASMAPLSQLASCDNNLSFDTNASVSDLFGQTVSSDFSFQETGSPAQLGVPDSTQSPSLWWGNGEDVN